MLRSILDRICSILEQYNQLEIEEPSPYTLIIKLNNYTNYNIRIDVRDRSQEVWISSNKFNAYQFHIKNNTLTDKKNDNNTLSNILFNIIKKYVPSLKYDEISNATQL